MENKKALGFVGISFIVLGILAIIFIYKTGLLGDFLSYIKQLFLKN